MLENARKDSSLLVNQVQVYEAVDDTYWFKDFSTDAWTKTKSYFEGRTRFEGEQISSNPNWFFILLLFCLSLIAFVRAFHRKRFVLISKILLNWKLGKQIIRYEKVYTHPVNLALILNYLLVLPVFSALCIYRYFQTDYSVALISLWLFLGLLLFQVGRFLLYLFSAWIFEEKEIIDEYIFHVNLLSKFQGMVFLILLVLMLYTSISLPLIINTALFILLLSLGIQILRGVRIGFQKTKNLILIILYLCTLEILPLLILVKKVIQAINFS